MTVAIREHQLESTRFAADGFIGPIDFLTPAECSLLSRYFDDADRPAPLEWSKGSAASDRVIYDLATRPPLVSLLRQLLGANVILWGASVVDRAPGQRHAWHTDIESSAPDSRCVTVWIGLENASVDSSLKLICGSQRIGKALQCVAAEHGVAREDRTAEAALEWARGYRSGATLIEPAMQTGQALLFDGRLWHGSVNSRASGRRRALLLQYAAADFAVRIPDWTHLDWPFVFHASPLPPVITVAGRASRRANRIVSPPPRSPERLARLTSVTRSIPWPLARDPARGWRPHPQFRGSTPVLGSIGCHVSVLDPGHSPHPPHAHFDEEVLIVLDGQAELRIADGSEDPAPRREVLESGDFVYYPPYQFHTIRCPGPDPVSYLMFRWHGRPLGSVTPLPTSIFRGFSPGLVFESPTAFLRKLHCHRSRKTDGAGYEPHVDEHDGALVLLRGQFRTGGRTVRAPAVVFQPAGEWHGLRGVGEVPAEYIVLEFHAPHTGTPRLDRALLQAATGRLLRLRSRVRSTASAIRRRLGAR
jgi:mannose-6-phosphate isomerase-like protein (cupin superfamily)